MLKARVFVHSFLLAAAFAEGCGSTREERCEPDGGNEPADATTDARGDSPSDATGTDVADVGKLKDGGSDDDSGIDSGVDASSDAGLDAETDFDASADLDASGADLDGGTDADAGSVSIPSGIPTWSNSAYTDIGPSPANSGFRALLGFRLRNEGTLDAAIQAIYQAGPTFRQYQTLAMFLADHAPTSASINQASAFLESCGFVVPRSATNHLLLEFTGTIGQFNACFSTEVHTLQRNSDPSVTIYGIKPPQSLSLPAFLSPISNGILTLDIPAPTGTLIGEAGGIVSQDPGNTQYTPQMLSHAYHADELAALAHTGTGAKIGIAGTRHFKFKDVQSFWQSFGITRADPTIIATMEPLVSRSSETTATIEWAGAMAPGASLTVYSGPDFTPTSLLYTLNEAVGRNEVDIVSFSHGRRETSDGVPARDMYHWISKQAAVTGMTIVASAGNDMNAELPCVSPLVTCIGGSELVLDGSNNRVSEVFWRPDAAIGGGTGNSITMNKPDYQSGLAALSGTTKRAVVDMSLTARRFYWVYWLGNWEPNWGGTELGAPVFAGMMARVHSFRVASGKPRAGFLNRAIYTDTALQNTFFDITSGSAFVSQDNSTRTAGTGWDYPTGWGAPSAIGIAQNLP